MFRHERPQQGRFRQFHQIGVEVFGVQSPLLDAEMIHMLDLYLKGLGLKNLEIEINSLGCPICRPHFHRAFHQFVTKHRDALCEECQKRIEKNPLRILDCKEEKCRSITEDAPSIQDHLCEDCERDFDTVLELLGHLGSPYQVNPRIVRGLDYYTKTTFEFTTQSLGAQNAVAGGGRYDGLVRLMGGPSIPGIGFAIGAERLVELLQGHRGDLLTAKNIGIFIAPIGDKALQKSLEVAQQLRDHGVRVDLDYDGKSLKAQMRRADKSGARLVLILGEDELKKKVAVVRDMGSQSQEEIPLDTLVEKVRHRVGLPA
jgi:histidyl-tRNA synthetase